ncbi:MAG TPA: hypothetical protein VGO68_01020 [Pyrinomonadaceae bacterium]|jgi:hypothetical protein|nr:hypothetical protein [Pyrinomonadaceae bacterium]
MKSANIREFVTLERSGWRPLAGGWSVQQSQYGCSQQFIPQLWLIFQVAIFVRLIEFRERKQHGRDSGEP